MSKGGGRRRSSRRRGYILDQTSVLEIQQTKERVQALLKCQWDFYSELAYQRKQIEPELTAALARSTTAGFELQRWQRAVRYRYSFHPFSTVGSLSDPGGRFNIGDIDPTNFPTFAALYLASDKDTALQETLGQTPPPAGSGLTAREMALTNPQSETIVSVSGRLETILDLRSPASLESFVDLIKGFTLSPALIETATRLGLAPTLQLGRTAEPLLNALLMPEWRFFPMNCDVPASSQLFGQLALLAGIEGIVFPKNLATSQGYLELDDPTPHPKVPTRIDSSNWSLCERTPDELIK